MWQIQFAMRNLGPATPDHPILAPKSISCSPYLLFCTGAGWQRQSDVHTYAEGWQSIVARLRNQ